MLKHIIGQSIYQISILCVIIFLGDRFIPENLPDELDANGKSMIYSEGTKFIRSGRLKHPFSIANDYHPLEIVNLRVLAFLMLALDVRSFKAYYHRFQHFRLSASLRVLLSEEN
jgi:hypothetical protein